MASSLKKLASYLDEKRITSNIFENDDNYTKNNIKLLVREGIFPYDYVSSFDTLKEKDLPSKDDFFSKLTNSGIAEADNDHAVNVWITFNIKTLGVCNSSTTTTFF